MFRARLGTLLVATILGGYAGGALGSTLEEQYIAGPGWCPGIPGVDIQAEHDNWHMVGFAAPVAGKEFVEFHREFLAHSDDYRFYGLDTPVGDVDPDPAAFAVTATPGALLRFAHTSLNGYTRPANHAIDPIHPHPGAGMQSAWVPRPANLFLRNALFHGYSANGVGTALDGMFHGNGHMSIAGHDRVGFPFGDMGNTMDATRDGAFFQWHKNIDNIYADWAVGQYQGVANTGLPIYFSVDSAGVGAPPSSVRERRQSNEYQGNNPPGANQYGAAPRIGSDIYVGNLNGSNLTYRTGSRRPGTPSSWDTDGFSILNPPGSAWYFSVTQASVGLPGTAVNAQASRGGDVYTSAGGGVNALFRTEAQLGLLPAASDNLDGLEIDDQKRVQATNDNALVGVYDRPRQWFSLQSGTMAGLTALGGALVTPSDVLLVNPNGDLVVGVPAATFGLVAADDMDGMVIVDTAPTDVLNGTDRIYYSLRAGSPGLAGSSPADIFCHRVDGTPCGTLGGRLEMTAGMLGLLATDDVDGLDVLRPASGTGACCMPDGSCFVLSQGNCPGIFWGPETVCEATPCPSEDGACCLPSGGCVLLSDANCRNAQGRFLGAGTPCLPDSCPQPPGNDECYNPYPIPYNYPEGYQPPADNTYGTSAGYDPLYGCYDHMIFFPEYGSGTIWYTYDVPAGPPGRGIGLTTAGTYDVYEQGGYAADTRLALYYSPSGTCSTLVQVACSDNYYESYSPPSPPQGGYAYLQYNDPQPGRYYVQLATVGEINRGVIKLEVYQNITAVGDGAIPKGFRLALPSPNPSLDRVELRYELPQAAQVKLRIYDVSGRAVATIIDAERPAGSHGASWDGRDAVGTRVGAGVYFARMEAGGEVQTEKFVLVR